MINVKFCPNCNRPLKFKVKDNCAFFYCNKYHYSQYDFTTKISSENEIQDNLFDILNKKMGDVFSLSGENEKMIEFLNRHKNFLDFIKNLYFNKWQWPSTIIEEEIDGIMKKYTNDFDTIFNNKTVDFYKLIIKAIPIIFSNNKYSRQQIQDFLGIGDGSLVRYVLPYLNPSCYEKKEYYPSISNNTKLVLARYIYKIMEFLNDNTNYVIVLDELNKILSSLKENSKINYQLSWKLDNEIVANILDNYKKFEVYLIHLITVIQTIRLYFIKKEKIDSIREVARNLIKNNNIISDSENSLSTFIVEIIEDLGENIPDFLIQRQIQKSQDMIIGFDRELFYKLYPNASPEEVYGVSIFFKKMQLIKDLSKIKNILPACKYCGTSFEYLPAIVFNHEFGKEISWKDILKKPYPDILEIMLKEYISIVCRNCHNLIHSDIYNEFKDFIDNPDLFLSSKEIINIYLQNLSWIKKREV